MSAADYRRDYDALHAGTAAPAARKGVKSTDPSISQLLAPPKKKRGSPEEELQRQVFEWVFAHEARYPCLKLLFHPPNGGARSKGEAGKLKAMGVRKGIVDLIQPFPQPGGGLGFACELKAGKGALSTDQRTFLTEAKRHGWVVGVAYDLETFLVLIHQYLGVAWPPAARLR